MVTLPAAPARIAKLPLNERGYPVPRFVEWIDGKPDFRIMDERKRMLAITESLCWICGEKLGAYRDFVIGPMCAVNRVSSEPPSHSACADYAAVACPFLAKPKMVRREAGLPEEVKSPGGFSVNRNPGCILVWTSAKYHPIKVPGGWLISIGEPTALRAFAEGRKATLAEVKESIRTGLPFLQAKADEEGPSAQLELAGQVARAYIIVDRMLA